MSQIETCGFIGVGVMGGTITRRLLAAGRKVVAYDVSEAARGEIAAAGGEVAGSVREVADACELVFACLPNPEISKAVAFGPDGVIGAARMKIYAEVSTLGGETIIEIADQLGAAGVDVLDSPIVGSTLAVEQGNAGVLVSGAKTAFERVRPWFETYGGRVFYLGPEPGAAQAAKVMNNAVAYACVLATCEALALGSKSGIDMETALAIINQGSGANFFSQRVAPAFYPRGVYEGIGALQTGVKDLGLFLDEARRLDVPTPMADGVSELMTRVWQAGEPRRDMLQAIHYFTDAAGLERGGA